MLAALMTDPDAGHRSAAQIHRRLVADGRGLDLASVPTTMDGIDQEPMAGTSFVHTFDDAAAEERHTVQYFEMFGSRAIYQDGIVRECLRTRDGRTCASRRTEEVGSWLGR